MRYSVPFQLAKSSRPLTFRWNSTGILHESRKSETCCVVLARHLVCSRLRRNFPSRQPNNRRFVTPRCNRCKQSPTGNCSIMSMWSDKSGESSLWCVPYIRLRKFSSVRFSQSVLGNTVVPLIWLYSPKVVHFWQPFFALKYATPDTCKWTNIKIDCWYNELYFAYRGIYFYLLCTILLASRIQSNGFAQWFCVNWCERHRSIFVSFLQRIVRKTYSDR